MNIDRQMKIVEIAMYVIGGLFLVLLLFGPKLIPDTLDTYRDEFIPGSTVFHSDTVIIHSTVYFEGIAIFKGEVIFDSTAIFRNDVVHGGEVSFVKQPTIAYD